MRITHVTHVGHQFVGQFGVIQRAVVIVQHFFPRPDMNLVHCIRFCFCWRMFPALLHPYVITPFVVVLPHDRSRHWRRLAVKSEWVCFFQQFSGIGTDGVLVRFSLAYVGKESLPDATFVPTSVKKMTTRLPMIEIPDYGNLACIWCPDGKVRTPLTLVFHWVCAQLFIKPKVLACFEQIDVKVGKQTKRFSRLFCGFTFRPLSHLF